MRILLALILSILVAACSSITPEQAKKIAYERLSASSDRPSLQGTDLLAALSVQEQQNGMFLVELRDDPRNRLWAVIVQQSGESEITHMAIDG